MVKFLKPGKVVVVLRGRYAGRKAIIVKNYDDGKGARGYGHCVLAGVDKYPLRVAKYMSKKRIARRSKVIPFVKVMNYNHVMPTRYTFDGLDLKKVDITAEVIKDPTQKSEKVKDLRKSLETTYKAGNSPWFFQKLRF